MTPEERADDLYDRCHALLRVRAVPMMVAAIRAAVLEERERCAKIAETWVDPEHKEYRPEATGCDAAFNEGLECSAVSGIAAAIRKGT